MSTVRNLASTFITGAGGLFLAAAVLVLCLEKSQILQPPKVINVLILYLWVVSHGMFSVWATLLILDYLLGIPL
jgi:hypothetical protein